MVCPLGIAEQKLSLRHYLCNLLSVHLTPDDRNLRTAWELQRGSEDQLRSTSVQKNPHVAGPGKIHS